MAINLLADFEKEETKKVPVNLLENFEKPSKQDPKKMADAVANQTGIDVNLFRNLIAAESSWNPNAKSPVGAIGYTQLMPTTAKGLGVDPNNPESNLKGGAKYLKQLLNQYGGNQELALVHYNGGSGAVSAWKKGKPYKESVNYVKTVLGTVSSEKQQNLLAGFEADSKPQVSPGERAKRLTQSLPDPKTGAWRSFFQGTGSGYGIPAEHGAMAQHPLAYPLGAYLGKFVPGALSGGLGPAAITAEQGLESAGGRLASGQLAGESKLKSIGMAGVSGVTAGTLTYAGGKILSLLAAKVGLPLANKVIQFAKSRRIPASEVAANPKNIIDEFHSFNAQKNVNVGPGLNSPPLTREPITPIKSLGYNPKKFSPKSQEILKNVTPGLSQAEQMQRRGKMTMVQVSDLAEKTGFKNSDFLSIPPGTAFNEEQTMFLKDALENGSNNLFNLAVKYGKNPSPGLEREVQRSLIEHAQLYINFSGARTTWGRVGNVLQTGASGIKPSAETVKTAEEVVKEMLSSKPLDQFLKDLREGGRLRASDYLIKEAKPSLPKPWWKKSLDALVEYSANAKLFATRTLLKHDLGRGFALANRLFEESISSPVDIVYSKITGGPRTRFSHEAVADATAMFSAIPRAFKNFFNAIKTEGTKLGFTYAEGYPDPTIPGLLGKLIRMPARWINAFDVGWTTLNEEGVTAARAMRQAMTEGAKDVTSRSVELIENMTTGFKRDVIARVQEDMFRQELGPIGKMIQNVQRMPGVRVAVPFLKTYVNLFSYPLKRTPGLGLLPQIGGEVKIPGATVPIPMIDRWIRTTGGALVMIPILYKYLRGEISGKGPHDPDQREISGKGPHDPGQQQLLKSLGWQPESIKFGNRWVSGVQYEPVWGYVNKIIALNEIKNERDLEHAAYRIMEEIGTAMGDNPGMVTIQDTLAVLSNPESPKFEKWLDDFATGMLPQQLRAERQRVDPLTRQQSGLKEALMNAIPGLSSKLTPRLNILGEPEIYEGGAWRAYLPYRPSTAKENPAAKELLHHGIDLKSVAKSVQGFGGTSPEGIGYNIKFQVSPEITNQKLKERGNEIKDFVVSNLSDPWYQSQTDTEKRDFLFRNVFRIMRRYGFTRDERKEIIKSQGS